MAPIQKTYANRDAFGGYARIISRRLAISTRFRAADSSNCRESAFDVPELTEVLNNRLSDSQSGYKALLNFGGPLSFVALPRSSAVINHDVTETLKVEPVVLEGKHVRLEPLTLAHAEDLARAAADGELWNSDVTIIPKPDGMKAYIEAALKGFALGFELPFAIVRKAGSATLVVGTTRYYEIFSDDRKAAIGYTWLARSAQRTPVNMRSQAAAAHARFETLECSGLN